MDDPNRLGAGRCADAGGVLMGAKVKQRERGTAKPTFCECGDHAFANLTRGFVVLVSPEDAHLLLYHWQADKNRRGYVMVSRSKCVARGKQKKALISREIANPSPDQYVDHANRVSLDNRRHNLRCCLPVDNNRNCLLKVQTITGIKGVKLAPSGRFEARIKFGGRRHHIGTFTTKDEARLAYAVAAYWFHGEFARIS